MDRGMGLGWGLINDEVLSDEVLSINPKQIKKNKNEWPGDGGDGMR